MHIKLRNVNDAFTWFVRSIHDGYLQTTKKSSRAGDVLQVDEPMIITYEKPLERVLFNKARDGNPFFWLYESLWMLAGCDNVDSLAYYNSRMIEHSDDGNTLNGAYGYRWRHHYDYYVNTVGGFETSRGSESTDQLKVLIDHLKARPESRRAVLQMWNVEDDLLKIDSSKDVCCNLSVLFSLRLKDEIKTFPDFSPDHWPTAKCNYLLDMTVFNRSNDLIWGTLGSDYVNFSFLQEYVAANLGVDVGKYHQVTNNLHVYINNFKPDEWLNKSNQPTIKQQTYDDGFMKTRRLVSNINVFDEEVQRFVECNGNYRGQSSFPTAWFNSFLDCIAQPMCNAFHMHKLRDYPAALSWIEAISDDDWRTTSRQWIQRRQESWKNKSTTT